MTYCTFDKILFFCYLSHTIHPQYSNYTVIRDSDAHYSHLLNEAKKCLKMVHKTLQVAQKQRHIITTLKLGRCNINNTSDTTILHKL